MRFCLQKYSTFLFAVVVGIAVSSCSKKELVSNQSFRDKNACKKLMGDVLVFPVFVDDKGGDHWTPLDKKQFLDSMNVGLAWIQKNASADNIRLRFVVESPSNQFKNGLPGNSIPHSITMLDKKASYAKFNKHYDGVAKAVGNEIAKKDTGELKVQNVKTSERLIAQLRNIYKTESVVLIYIHKNQYLDHIYECVNTLDKNNVEYLVTSFKSPTVIAYQVLEIFGASPMTYSSYNKDEVEAKQFMEMSYPNEIMGNVSKNIRTLEMSPFTKYMVGWNNKYDPMYEKFVSTRYSVSK